MYQALDIVEGTLQNEENEERRLRVALRVLSSMRIAKMLFAKVGEESLTGAMNELIRKKRIDEGVDPNLPIDRHEREDLAAAIVEENVTRIKE